VSVGKGLSPSFSKTTIDNSLILELLTEPWKSTFTKYSERCPNSWVWLIPIHILPSHKERKWELIWRTFFSEQRISVWSTPQRDYPTFYTIQQWSQRIPERSSKASLSCSCLFSVFFLLQFRNNYWDIISRKMSDSFPQPKRIAAFFLFLNGEWKITLEVWKEGIDLLLPFVELLIWPLGFLVMGLETY